LRHITQLIERYPYLVVMGDFNCDCRSRSLRQLARESGLQGLDCELKTFPSWRPRRNLDHILVSGSLRILEVEVLDYVFSDHLPLSMTVALPSGVHVL
jgi:endonuclease/exonuclease/phosphatase family metal-dependent hydrolase